MTNLYINPPKGLLEKIINLIHKEERILVLRKIIFLSVLLLASMGGFIPSLSTLISDVNKSGFLNFFSLMFSDFSSVTVYWKSFVMMLLETLPAVSLALFLAVILTFLQSAKSLSKNIKIIKSHHLLAH